MNNTQFDKFRREAEVTSAQIADWAGCTRKHMLNVETGHEPVQPWMIKAVEALKSV